MSALHQSCRYGPVEFPRETSGHAQQPFVGAGPLPHSWASCTARDQAQTCSGSTHNTRYFTLRHHPWSRLGGIGGSAMRCWSNGSTQPRTWSVLLHGAADAYPATYTLKHRYGQYQRREHPCVDTNRLTNSLHILLLKHRREILHGRSVKIPVHWEIFADDEEDENIFGCASTFHVYWCYLMRHQTILEEDSHQLITFKIEGVFLLLLLLERAPPKKLQIWNFASSRGQHI